MANSKLSAIGDAIRCLILLTVALLGVSTQSASGKVLNALEVGKTVQMLGGDDRDVFTFTGAGTKAPASGPSIFSAFVPKRAVLYTGPLSLIITPQGVQSRAIILYDANGVEFDRKIMDRDQIVFALPSSVGYTYVRVTPVGSRYYPASGSNLKVSATNPDAPVMPLEPYIVALRESASLQPAPARITPAPPRDIASKPEPARPTTANRRPEARPTKLVATEKPAVAPDRVVQRAAAADGARIALVVGNGNYGALLGNLANSVPDTKLVARSLQAAGFQVEIVNNVDQKTMKRAFIRFGQRLMTAGPGSTGLFYYAGHGVQSRGTNYLVPVNAAITNEADLDIEAVPADAVVRQMEEAGASTSIVILDACRNLPIARSARSGARGLARMEAPNGSYIAYSTAPGEVALDGTGTNSPFAKALVDEMARPGVAIEEVFRKVRKSVLTQTDGKQTPWDSSSLIDSFVFSQ